MAATTEPQPPAPFEPYSLTPLDCVNIPFHVPAAFVFIPASIEAGIEAGIEALERGISRLVAQLPFLTGNVILGPGNGGVVKPPKDKYLEENPIIRIQAHPKSISILHAPNFGFDDGLSSDSFLPIPISLKAPETSPVIRFCINVMTDGLILCASFHHAAMDGLGTMNVIRMIGMCCASPSIPRLPVSSPSEASLRARVLKIATDGPFMNIDGYGPHHWSQSRLTSCELRFPAERVRQLAKLCNSVRHKSLLGNGDMGPVKGLSTSDVMSALLWLCRTHARSEACSPSTSPSSHSAGTTRLSLTVNIRDVLKPPLPLSFLGGAMVVASGTHARHEMEASRRTTATSIDNNDLLVLATLAANIHRIIHSVDNEYVCRVIRHIRGSRDRQNASFYFPDTFVTNVRLLDLRRWDFGPELGKVVDFEHVETRIDGLCAILPRCHGDSGDSPWKVRVTLEPEAMERFRGDGLIRWVAGNESSCNL